MGVFECCGGNEEFEIEVSGKYISNDDESMIRMALNGTGIIQHLDFAIAEHINAGKLQPILEDWAVSFHGFYICFITGENAL